MDEIEQEINRLKLQLKQFMELVLGIGEEPPEEIQDLVLQVIQHIGGKIEALRSQQGQSDTNAEPSNLTPGPYPSSNINAFAYDPESGELKVKFQDKYPSQNGPIYSYSGVPSYIFDLFRRGAVAPRTSGRNQWHEWKKGVTPSLGASMYGLIRAGGYPYQRLS